MQPRRVARLTPLVLGLLSVGAIGFWWALVPHALSTLALGLAVRGGGDHAEVRPRRLPAALIVAGAVIVLSVTNDLAALRGRAFLPRWE